MIELCILSHTVEVHRGNGENHSKLPANQRSDLGSYWEIPSSGIRFGGRFKVLLRVARATGPCKLREGGAKASLPRGSFRVRALPRPG